MYRLARLGQTVLLGLIVALSLVSAAACGESQAESTASQSPVAETPGGGGTGGGRGTGEGRGAGGGSGGGAGQAATETGYAIAISLDGQQVARYGLDDLRSLEFVSIEADGRAEEGPRLLDVLQKAGIESFSSVTVRGQAPGRIGSAELTLEAAEVTDQVVLDVSQRDTLKLAGPEIDSNRWVVDVTEIAVTS